MSKKPHGYDKVIYLLQGGGALGSYQVGVCQALLEYGCTPDWLIGTSIGAINAAIIAGNKPENRIKKLKEFWRIIASPIPILAYAEKNYALEQMEKSWSSLWSLIYGQPGFFKPRLFNPWLVSSSYPDQISFYDTGDLRKTLEKLIDFDMINRKEVRLTLAALCVEGGNLVYFDNAKQTIGPEHIMASSALPPGFPAIRIAGKNYWDGGLSSNTPFNAVLQEDIPDKILCIMAHLFSYHERTPATLLEIFKLKKDIEFSSRYHQIINYMCEIQHLHNILHTIVKDAPEVIKKDGIKDILKLSHPIVMNVVRFHYRDYPSNLWVKDFDFSPESLLEHYQTGYRDVSEALKNPTWLNQIPESVELHEF
jgi:NTE family protein